MIEQIYTCDRCGRSTREKKDLALSEVSVGVRSLNQYQYIGTTVTLFDPKQRKAEWCLECLFETGLAKKGSSHQKEPETFPSLEDMVRDIIREEISSVR